MAGYEKPDGRKKKMRIVRIFWIFRAQRIVQNGDFGKARKIVRRLISKCPKSVGYNLFLADIETFAGNLEKALGQYEISKTILEEEPEISSQNRRYYAAYMNFRTTAIKFNNAGQEWPEWMEVARIIEGLNADKNIKRLFLLPN